MTGTAIVRAAGTFFLCNRQQPACPVSSALTEEKEGSVSAAIFVILFVYVIEQFLYLLGILCELF